MSILGDIQSSASSLLTSLFDHQDTGIKAGKNYAVNVPLRDGINDVSFPTIFEPVRTL
jgi:acetoin utilization deacetylase AcuC-like enzyme